MGENRGQTIFLSVIGIATLLVAIIGATFAYFTTQVKSSGTGGSLTGNTAKLSGTTLTFDKNTSNTHDYLKYPGGLAVFGTKATLEKTDTEANDENDYVATFNLEINYNNPTKTTLGYTLYMLETPPVETNLDPKCKLLSKVVGTDTYLWYGDADDTVEELSSVDESQCTFEDADINVFSGATTVASGDIAPGSGKIDSETELGTSIQLTDKPGENPLKGRQLDTKDTSTKYYYLVVEYPNEDKNQGATDANATITASLTISDGSITVNQGTVATD